MFLNNFFFFFTTALNRFQRFVSKSIDCRIKFPKNLERGAKFSPFREAEIKFPLCSFSADILLKISSLEKKSAYVARIISTPMLRCNVQNTDSLYIVYRFPSPTKLRASPHPPLDTCETTFSRRWDVAEVVSPWYSRSVQVSVRLFYVR